MPIDKATEVIREYLSSCNGDTVVHISKDHIIATLSQECSDNGIDPEVRDNHPFMRKLHEAQDGIAFNSYQDLMVFAEDVVSGLPEPSTPLPTTSKELQDLEAQLSREDLSLEEKKVIFDRHQETSKILNEVLMAEKRKGFFHKPKENAYFVSEDSIQRYLSAQKRDANQDDSAKPTQAQAKSLSESQSQQAHQTKESGNSNANKGEKDYSPLIEQHQKMHAEKMRAEERQLKQNKAGMDAHLAYRNPSREVVDSLMKIGGLGLDVMGTGLKRIAESAMAKKDPGNQVFLSSIANRNHEAVSNSINETSLAMEELGKMMGVKNPTADDIAASHKFLDSISKNSSLLSEKMRRGVLNASDREAISDHGGKVAEFLDRLRESDFAKSMDNESIKKLLESIFNALKNILPGDRGQHPEPSNP